MSLDELINFDKYNLTYYKLIYQYYKPGWFSIGLASFLIGFASLFFCVFNLTYLRWLALLVGILFLSFLIYYIRKKTLFVLKSRYEKVYNLKLSKGWNNSDILKVRFGMFSDYIKDTVLADKDKLRTVIEYLDNDSGATRYNYRLAENTTLVIIAALLSGFVSVSLGKAKDFIETSRLFLSIGLLLIFMVVYVEKFIIKEIVLWKRSRNNRLKQIIYCYLVEK